MPTKFTPLPAPGDILWCKFPHHNYPGVPAYKCRPVLVKRVSTQKHTVEVAYGTSQKTDNLYPGEFAVDPSDVGFAISGLDVRTKFDISRTVVLPFDDEWFATAPILNLLNPVPKMGSLHISYSTVLRATVVAIKPVPVLRSVTTSSKKSE